MFSSKSAYVDKEHDKLFLFHYLPLVTASSFCCEIPQEDNPIIVKPRKK